MRLTALICFLNKLSCQRTMPKSVVKMTSTKMSFQGQGNIVFTVIINTVIDKGISKLYKNREHIASTACVFLSRRSIVSLKLVICSV